MNRKNLLYTLDILLGACKSCEHNTESGSPENKCKGCETYPQIRWIGDQLGRKKQMAKLTLEEYQDYKAQGKSDAEIAKILDIKHPTLIYYKKQWQISPKQANTSEVKQKECSCNGKEINAAYEGEIGSLKDERNHLDNLCKQQTDVISRLSESKKDLQWEYDKLKSKEYQDSYIIEEQKKRIQDLGKTLELLTKENSYLWGLIGLQVAEKHV